MDNMHPLVFLLISFVLLWFGVFLGIRIRGAVLRLSQDDKFISVLEGALLTLFGLLIGFTFSMAMTRYDKRVDLIVKEANAIGTTWLRTSTLPDPVRTQSQHLLRQYVAVRVDILAVGSDLQKAQADLASSGSLQDQLWSVASGYAMDHRDPVTALYLATLNDSIDTSEERTAAYQNRVPGEAWGLLLFIGFAAMIVVGLDATPHAPVLKVILPFVLAGSLAMTLDLDSPRYGLIKLHQPSMIRLQQQVSADQKP